MTVDRLALSLAAVLVLCGCTTSSVREQNFPDEAPQYFAGRKVQSRVEVMNSGVFLFYFIPLWSGEYIHPNRRDYDTFENQVEPKFARRMLDIELDKHRDCKLEAVSVTTRATGWWSLGILWKRTVFGRALIVENEPSARPENKTGEK